MRNRFIIVCIQFMFICNVGAQLDTIYKLNNGWRVEFKQKNDTSEYRYRKYIYNNENILLEEYDAYVIDTSYTKRHGSYKIYHLISTKLWMEGHYDTLGIVNGIFRFYYPNGAISKEESFFEGKKKGDAIFYYKNGTIEARGKFDYMFYKPNIYNDLYLVESKVKKWIYYHPNGLKKAQGRYYFNSIIEKKDKFESPNKYVGNTPIYYNWKTDVKDGVWRYWDEEGKLIKKENYSKGKLLKVKKY